MALGCWGMLEGKVERVLGRMLGPGCRRDAVLSIRDAAGLACPEVPPWTPSGAELPALSALLPHSAAPSLLPPSHSVPLTRLWLLALVVADTKAPQNSFPFICFGAGRGRKGPLRGHQDTPQSSSLGRAADKEQGEKDPENCSDLQNQTRSVSMVITGSSSW